MPILESTLSIQREKIERKVTKARGDGYFSTVGLGIVVSVL
jgi:hypothetical protein